MYTKPTYNPSLYIPLMNPRFPFIYYPRFDFRSKITSLNSLRLNLLLVSSSCCCSSTRSSTRNKRYDEPPSLSNWRGTEGGRPPPRLQYPKEFHSAGRRWFWPRPPSCLCFLHLGKGEEGRNWRRYANNSRNAIAQDSEASGLRTCRGYVARALGSADTRLCGPARSAPLPGLLPYHGCGGSLECGSHIRHSATTGVTSH